MRIKTRNSLWIVLALVAFLVLQSIGLILQGGQLREQAKTISDQSISAWSQKASSDADLAACQEAVEIAQDVFGTNPQPITRYTFDAVSDDCLRR